MRLAISAAAFGIGVAFCPFGVVSLLTWVFMHFTFDPLLTPLALLVLGPLMVLGALRLHNPWK